MTRNAWFLQRQADVLGLPVLRATEIESTALGAAFLAGLKAGVWPDLAAVRRLTQQARRFEPAWSANERQRHVAQWRKAVQAVIAFYTESRPTN
jgi:glycerol kinase